MGSLWGRESLQGTILLLAVIVASSFATDADFRGGVIMSRRRPGDFSDVSCTEYKYNLELARLRIPGAEGKNAWLDWANQLCSMAACSY